MGAGWVAGSVRARALAQRRLGPATARRIAACGSLREAQQALAGTARGHRVRPGQDLAAAQHEIASALLWDLRVLAGWLPPDGVRRLRVLAAWFELANVDEMLQGFGGRAARAQFQLGGLATAWPRLRQAGDRGALRAALAGTDWRDPGGESNHALRLGMRMRYAARAAALGDPVRTWAMAAMALLIAGDLSIPGGILSGGGLSGALLRDAASLLGPAAVRAKTFEELAGALPSDARWVLDETTPGTLWRAEATWRHRVERDGLRLLRTSLLDSSAVLGAVAVMACDAWRASAVLEVAARGGLPIEAYDELA